MGIDFGPYRLIQLLGHRDDGVNAVAFSPDGSWLASGASDGLIRIWNPMSGAELRVLEGHEGEVTSLAISPDGQWLASGADDRTVRPWEAATGKPLLAFEQHPFKLAGLGLAFVTEPIAAEPFAEGAIWLRALDPSSTDWSARPTSEQASVVASAKLVLLGESGAGKSALALRLAEDRYEDQPTTHGMRIWRLDPGRLDPQSAAPAGERRELVLWDLGGQDEYRLIHQLFIHDTELAPMLFDPTRGKGEAEDVLEWNARLEAQRESQPTTKLLVGSKLDDGDASVDRTEVDRLLVDCLADAFLPTSAKTAFGIPVLRQALAARIDWAGLARTTRPALFQRVRDEIDRLQTQGEVTLPLTDLHALVQRADPDDYDGRGVDQVVE